MQNSTTLLDGEAWHGVLSMDEVWSWSSGTAAVVLAGSASGYLAHPKMKSKTFIFLQNLIIATGMSAMLAVVFFEVYKL